MSVIMIVADGARPDTMARAIGSGATPALAEIRRDGALHTVTTCAPSVTGPAYAPFLMGRYPAPIGLPGLRWFDRSRTTCRLPGHSRSYVGFEVRRVNTDIDGNAPTVFDVVPSSIATLNTVITRGLRHGSRVGNRLLEVRGGICHFRGDVSGWLRLERRLADMFESRVLHNVPDFAFAALTGLDKTSHAFGQDSPAALDALKVVDGLVGRLRAGLEKRGRWRDTHLWIVSDHGHSPVREHEDLVRLVRDWGHTPRAHPFVYTNRGDVAVMVSGNALAHLYVDLETRTRRWWPSHAARWEPLAQQLLARASVDLLLLPRSETLVEVRARGRGHAHIHATNGRYSYEPKSGNPLGIGPAHHVDRNHAHELCASSDYPDALVQIMELCTAPRAGDVVISACRDWDFRARHEPIPHVSSHGALHRDHMRVPLLMSQRPRGTPRRTVDIFPSALAALGVRAPEILDGESFF